MGTRCLTRFYEHGIEILCLYRQYDGYPTGHGDALARFIAERTIVNGLGGKDQKVANGMGCLAAQVVAHLKCTDGVPTAGGFYIHALGTSDGGEEYVYEVHADRLRCFKAPFDRTHQPVMLYDGPASGFDGEAAWP